MNQSCSFMVLKPGECHPPERAISANICSTKSECLPATQTQVNLSPPIPHTKPSSKTKPVVLFLVFSTTSNLLLDCYSHFHQTNPSSTRQLKQITQTIQSLPARMDSAVKTPDLKVQKLTFLPIIYESQTEDASIPATTASTATETPAGKATAREARSQKSHPQPSFPRPQERKPKPKRKSRSKPKAA